MKTRILTGLLAALATPALALADSAPSEPTPVEQACDTTPDAVGEGQSGSSATPAASQGSDAARECARLRQAAERKRQLGEPTGADDGPSPVGEHKTDLNTGSDAPTIP